MAKKIIGGIGGLLGIKKKKAAGPAATERKGPVVTPLAPGAAPAMRRRLSAAQQAMPGGKLGTVGKLGG